jgi:hypothetical protein
VRVLFRFNHKPYLELGDSLPPFHRQLRCAHLGLVIHVPEEGRGLSRAVDGVGVGVDVGVGLGLGLGV